MADTVFERAWGNYTALFEFLTKSDFDDCNSSSKRVSRSFK